MKRKTKFFLITVLSLGVIGGSFTAYGMHKYRDPAVFSEYIVERISSKLELDSTQQQSLSTLTDQILTNRQQLRTQFDPLSDKVVALVAADTFDQAQAIALIETKTAEVQASATDLVVTLGGFLDSLNAEQRKQVVEFIEHKIEHKKHHMLDD